MRTRSTVVSVGHVGVQLIDQGDAIVRMMQNGKEWESQTRKMWGELVQQCAPDDMILDVGAYTGVYAIASALMGWKVMALEPHPMNYARLLMNCALNSMRVDARPMAAASANGARTLYMKKRINDTASLDHANADPLCVDRLEVPTRRIDDLPLADARIGLIKIDVEHYEVDVLLGAANTIAKDKPLILVETLNAEAYDTVAMMLAVAGYRLRCVLDGRNKLFAVHV